MSYQKIQKELKRLADRDKAEILQRFFKTGPGEYGEGDIFLGITIPILRKLASEYDGAPISATLQLLRSSIHEERLLALLILIRSFTHGEDGIKKKIYDLYRKNIRYINNWDLVDLSAPLIVGAYLLDRDRKPLYEFARSRDLWKRRIAIVSTFMFIRQNDFSDTLRISKILLNDEHDLIHKSVGWMLREVGKRDRSSAESFIRKYCRSMPRTMLRYAIERFPESDRKSYLNPATRNPPAPAGGDSTAKRK